MKTTLIVSSGQYETVAILMTWEPTHGKEIVL